MFIKSAYGTGFYVKHGFYTGGIVLCSDGRRRRLKYVLKTSERGKEDFVSCAITRKGKTVKGFAYIWHISSFHADCVMFCKIPDDKTDLPSGTYGWAASLKIEDRMLSVMKDTHPKKIGEPKLSKEIGKVPGYILDYSNRELLAYMRQDGYIDNDLLSVVKFYPRGIALFRRGRKSHPILRIS